VPRPDLPPLTKRQAQILRLMAEGLTYDEVARHLGIMPSTLRSHMVNLFEILQVSNRTEAIMLAMGTVIDVEAAQAAVIKRCWGIDV
jgi:DNA-binding CsgD family transcriptional regulator